MLEDIWDTCWKCLWWFERMVASQESPSCSVKFERARSCYPQQHYKHVKLDSIYCSCSYCWKVLKSRLRFSMVVFSSPWCLWWSFSLFIIGFSLMSPQKFGPLHYCWELTFHTSPDSGSLDDSENLTNVDFICGGILVQLKHILFKGLAITISWQEIGLKLIVIIMYSKI